jgi:steroid delta-isomerase-like uncharacterized protein
MTDLKAFVHRWFDEVWNQGHEEAIDELFAADAVAHGLGEGDAKARGPAAFKVFWRTIRSALPDVQIRVEDTIVAGDKVAARVLLEGSHLGEGLAVPPTGRRVAISGIVIVRVSAGQIVEGWNSWDQLGMLQQLGAIPAPQGADRFLAGRQ